jgi:hypothetical protein
MLEAIWGFRICCSSVILRGALEVVRADKWTAVEFNYYHKNQRSHFIRNDFPSLLGDSYCPGVIFQEIVQKVFVWIAFCGWIWKTAHFMEG